MEIKKILKKTGENISKAAYNSKIKTLKLHYSNVARVIDGFKKKVSVKDRIHLTKSASLMRKYANGLKYKK